MNAPTKQEVENIVKGFMLIDKVLKAGVYPGTLAEELLSAIKFSEALLLNQQSVLKNLSKSEDSEEKVLSIN